MLLLSQGSTYTGDRPSLELPTRVLAVTCSENCYDDHLRSPSLLKLNTDVGPNPCLMRHSLSPLLCHLSPSAPAPTARSYQISLQGRRDSERDTPVPPLRPACPKGHPLRRVPPSLDGEGGGVYPFLHNLFHRHLWSQLLSRYLRTIRLFSNRRLSVIIWEKLSRVGQASLVCPCSPYGSYLVLSHSDVLGCY